MTNIKEVKFNKINLNKNSLNFKTTYTVEELALFYIRGKLVLFSSARNYHDNETLYKLMSGKKLSVDGYIKNGILYSQSVELDYLMRYIFNTNSRRTTKVDNIDKLDKYNVQKKFEDKTFLEFDKLDGKAKYSLMKKKVVFEYRTSRYLSRMKYYDKNVKETLTNKTKNFNWAMTHFSNRNGEKVIELAGFIYNRIKSGKLNIKYARTSFSDVLALTEAMIINSAFNENLTPNSIKKSEGRLVCVQNINDQIREVYKISKKTKNTTFRDFLRTVQKNPDLILIAGGE